MSSAAVVIGALRIKYMYRVNSTLINHKNECYREVAVLEK